MPTPLTSNARLTYEAQKRAIYANLSTWLDSIQAEVESHETFTCVTTPTGAAVYTYQSANQTRTSTAKTNLDTAITAMAALNTALVNASV